MMLDITIARPPSPIQIANPTRLSPKSSVWLPKLAWSKTAAVEKAVDAMLADRQVGSGDDFEARAMAILAQLDLIPDRADAFNPLDWDEHGLPR